MSRRINVTERVPGIFVVEGIGKLVEGSSWLGKVYSRFKTTSTRSAKSFALLKFLRKRSVDLWERSRSSRRSLTLGKSDGLVDVGSGSRVAVASDGGACDGVGSGGTGDMVWKYGVADDVADIECVFSNI
jgi:hypothetical protein